MSDNDKIDEIEDSEQGTKEQKLYNRLNAMIIIGLGIFMVAANAFAAYTIVTSPVLRQPGPELNPVLEYLLLQAMYIVGLAFGLSLISKALNKNTNPNPRRPGHARQSERLVEKQQRRREWLWLPLVLVYHTWHLVFSCYIGQNCWLTELAKIPVE